MANATDEPWTPPSEFDGFSLRGPIGRGGMGHVFLAYEAALDRRVAIKFITAAAPGRGARDRFLIEARAIARLQHPNVVSIFRIGEVDGRPYLASEFIDGRSLDRLPKPLPWSRALEIAIAVARGLSAAHSRGVLHRDIKPANVIEATDGSVKLVDFGLAKLEEREGNPDEGSAPVEVPDEQARGQAHTTLRIPEGSPWPSDVLSPATLKVPHAPEYSLDPGAKTVTGAVLGTPMFLAPELWMGAPATPQADVYSTGVLLYELCAGALPFSELVGLPLVRHVREVGLPPLAAARADIPKAFLQVVDRCVQRDPGERFATSADLLEALEAVHSVFKTFRKVTVGAPEDDASIITDSFARISGRTDELFSAVYDELFRLDPTLRALFPVDLAEQRGKLAVTFRLMIENLRAPERLVPILEDLGQRHVGYGVAARRLQVFGDALLICLERFEGPAWNPRLRAAWAQAYEAISGAMAQGMKAAEGMAVA